MRYLSARAPTRLDFGGGWTDVPPYSEEEGGCVCNVAISRCCVVRLSSIDSGGSDSEPGDRIADDELVRAALRRARLTDVDVDVRSDFPIGAGLGGSSAVGVAVTGALAAWEHRELTPEALAESSRLLEVEDLGIAGGRQDHYAAAFGGALGLWFGGETRVRRIPLAPALREGLERRCIVVYTGQSRISSDTITAVLDAYRARDRRVIEALACMKRLASEMIVALEGGDLDTLGQLVADHWRHQRTLHPSIPTHLIDLILERGHDAGALGGKALGASGGGCVLLMAPDDGAERVRAAVASLAQPLDVRIDETGFSWAAS